MARSIQLPMTHEVARSLHAGDELLLSGPVYSMRDAGHMRALDALEQHGELPFCLEGQTLFYVGPTPPAAGRPFGAVGPTTASRMDFAAPRLYAAGIVATIGKGDRSDAVRQACIDEGCVYLAAIGGAAALLATHVVSSEPIAWDDLGTEALCRLELRDFPVFVAFDTHGNDLYRSVSQGSGRA
jgi:fumarate hydratase subunit beta